MLIKIITGMMLISTSIIAQPDSRFETFDWILYQQTNQINSISEGYNYAYFATDNGGILRYHLYRDNFDEPLTTAQGLSDNRILAAHFDINTGVLWAATENSIDYSYNAQGDWFHVELNDLGIYRGTIIRRIGSSKNYIWIEAGAIFIKLDNASGILLGLFPSPDEYDIEWSSQNDNYLEIPVSLKDYQTTAGWSLNYDYYIDPYGKMVEPTTYYFGKYGQNYIGLEDGTIFIGNSQMEIYYPYNYGLNNSDVTAFTKDEISWIVGKNNFSTEGLTKLNYNTNEFQQIDYVNEINLSSRSFFSVLEMETEVWFGGTSVISIYDKKDDFWREISDAKGIPNGSVLSLVEDSTTVWVGTTKGLVEISKARKRAQINDVSKLIGKQKVNDIEIMGDNLWIATDYYLLIYDKSQNRLIDFKEYGNTETINNRKDIFTKFTDLYQINGKMFASTSLGILCYNNATANWMVAVEPSSYSGSTVNCIVIADEYCFIGTNNGFWQVNFKDGLSQNYDFSFIGNVQDMYILGDALMIGSEKGLIKYMWKKNV